MKKNTKNDRIKICYAFMSKCRDYNPLTKTFKTNMLMELPNQAPFELKYVRAIDLYFSDQGATKMYIVKELAKLGYDNCFKKAEEHIESCISGIVEFVGNELAVDVSHCDCEKELIEEIGTLVSEIEYICLKFKQKYMECDESNDNYDDDDEWWESGLTDDDYMDDFWNDLDSDEDDLWNDLDDEDNELFKELNLSTLLEDDESCDEGGESSKKHKSEKNDADNENIIKEEKQKNKGFSLFGLINRIRSNDKITRDNKDDIVDDKDDTVNNDTSNEADNNDKLASNERFDYIKRLNDALKQKIIQAEKTEAAKQNLCAVIVERFEMPLRLTAFAIGQYTKTPKEEVEEKLKNLPAMVANNMTADKAKQLISNLSMMKISAKIEYE